MRRWLSLIVSLSFVLSAQIAWSLPKKPSSEIFRGARWAIDMGTRAGSSGLDEVGLMSFLGGDFYSDLFFGGKHRGDLVLQMYLFDLRKFTPDGQAGSLFTYAPCVIAPNLILIPQGKLNVKFGHIWHAYGLRDQINTTQTLRQLISQDVMGLMLDWGVELNGDASILHYNVSLGTGTSGKWPGRDGGTYMGVARLGINGNHEALSYTPLKVGVSGLAAKIMSAQGLIERWRTGLDVQYQGRLNFLFEGSLGSDQSALDPNAASRDALAFLAELHWRSPTERWQLYLQQRYVSLESETASGMSAPPEMNEMMDMQTPVEMGGEMMGMSSGGADVKQSSTLGALYTPLQSLYLGAEFALGYGETASVGRLQVRYRW